MMAIVQKRNEKKGAESCSDFRGKHERVIVFSRVYEEDIVGLGAIMFVLDFEKNF